MTGDAGAGARRVLVIKLGALGDIVQSFDAFQAIRTWHRQAEIVLLTAPPYAELARSMPWFDAVWVDPRGRTPWAYLGIRRRLRAGRFDRVYDLQNQPRTDRYFALLWPGPRPVWSGSAHGCAYPRPAMAAKIQPHRERFLDQLAVAGVPAAGPADLAWLDADVSGFDLPARFVALVPGCSPHLAHKRWPPEHYAELALRLERRGMAAVLLGTPADRDTIAAISARAPRAVDLGGRTSLQQLAAVARAAQGAVGNDTGPIFLIAALGTPTLMLMSRHTDPARSAPQGRAAGWLKCEDLARLSVDAVEQALLRLG